MSGGEYVQNDSPIPTNKLYNERNSITATHPWSDRGEIGPSNDTFIFVFLSLIGANTPLLNMSLITHAYTYTIKRAPYARLR